MNARRFSIRESGLWHFHCSSGGHRKLLGLIAVQPLVERQLYSATTPRPVQPRGTLADFERTAIDIFDRVSPSVVHVAMLASVRDTVPKSPAERAGLRGIDLMTGELGDVIVPANDAPVRQLADLHDQIEQIGVGKTIQPTLKRRGSRATTTVEIADVSRSL